MKKDWVVSLLMIVMVIAGYVIGAARASQGATNPDASVEMDRRVWRGLRYFKLKDGCLVYFVEEGQVRGISWDATGKACEPYPR